MASWTRHLGIAAAAALVVGGVESIAASEPPVPAPTPDPVFPDAGSAGYDVEHYDWDLTIDPEAGSLRADVTVEAVTATALDEVTLDYSGEPLRYLAVDGVEAEHSYTGSKLVIDVRLPADARFEVSYEFDGTPEGTAFGWIARAGTVYTSAVAPGHMSSVLPLNDTPADPATYAIDITVADPYVATASGELVAVSEDGDESTYSFRVDLPASEVTLAAGELVVEPVAAPADVEGPDGLGVELTAALPPGDEDQLSHFAIAPEIIAFLEERLGPFPYRQLGFTIIDRFAGADSSPARIHLAHPTEVTLVHEIAHQWMGGLVGTASSTDWWLREGVPRYMELVWQEATDAVDLDTLAARVRDGLGAETRPPVAVSSLADRSDDVTYERGALTFHALHVELGDELFWDVLTTFYARFAGTSASTEDFIATVELVTGDRHDDLFDAWLREAPLPPPPQP